MEQDIESGEWKKLCRTGVSRDCGKLTECPKWGWKIEN